MISKCLQFYAVFKTPKNRMIVPNRPKFLACGLQGLSSLVCEVGAINGAIHGGFPTQTRRPFESSNTSIITTSTTSTSTTIKAIKTIRGILIVTSASTSISITAPEPPPAPASASASRHQHQHQHHSTSTSISITAPASA